MRTVQLSRKSVWFFLSVDVLTFSPKEGRNVLPLLSSLFPVAVAVLGADIFPEHNLCFHKVLQ